MQPSATGSPPGDVTLELHACIAPNGEVAGLGASPAEARRAAASCPAEDETQADADGRTATWPCLRVEVTGPLELVAKAAEAFADEWGPVELHDIVSAWRAGLSR